MRDMHNASNIERPNDSVYVDTFNMFKKEIYKCTSKWIILAVGEFLLSKS